MKILLNKEYTEKRYNTIDANEDLIDLIDAGYEIENFIGFVEIPKSMLDEEVPKDGFIDTQIQDTEIETYKELILDEFGNELEVTKERETLKFDENEKPIMRQKTWLEYIAGDKGNIISSKTAGNVLIRVGSREPSGLGHTIQHSELMDWVNYFGVGCLIEIGAVGQFRLTAEHIDSLPDREAVKSWIRQAGLDEQFNLTKSEETLKSELKEYYGFVYDGQTA